MNKKIVILNHFQLPEYIIDLIKEYSYRDITLYTKQKLSIIIRDINISPNLGNNPGEWIFKIPCSKQYNCEFCTRCGGYTCLSSMKEIITNSCCCLCFD